MTSTSAMERVRPVVSGDLNGHDPSEWDGGDTVTNDIIGFRPGTMTAYSSAAMGLTRCA